MLGDRIRECEAVAVNLNYAISPLLFGNGVVSMNQNCGVLFGAFLPEDFFEENETVFLKYHESRSPPVVADAVQPLHESHPLR